MQNAETVLDVLRERGRRGLPCDELYRQMFNPQLYLLAYGRIYSNQGAMTPGATQETVDGMSLGKIERIIDALRHERYRFSPVRRMLHPEKEREDASAGPADVVGQASRRGGAPAVGGVLRADSSPTAPTVSVPAGAATPRCARWPIPGPGRPGSSRVTSPTASAVLDHEVMIATLAEKIHDNRFLRLIAQHAAGRVPGGLDMERHAQRRAAGRGRLPVLSNIYLHKLDVFVETVLIPEYTRGSAQGTQPGVSEGANGDQAEPASAATALRCGHSASGYTVCPAGIRTIPAIGGCVTAATPTTPCSGSPDQKPKPRRSSSAGSVPA